MTTRPRMNQIDKWVLDCVNEALEKAALLVAAADMCDDDYARSALLKRIAEDIRALKEREDA